MTGGLYQGPQLGSWVRPINGTLVGRAVSFDLRTNEYVVLVPATRNREAVRLRFKAEEIVEVG